MKKLPVYIGACRVCPYANFEVVTTEYIHGYCKLWNLNIHGYEEEGIPPQCRLQDVEGE